MSVQVIFAQRLSDAQYLIDQISMDLMENVNEESCRSVCVTYADIRQRWVVTYSPEAYHRAVKTVDKQCAKISVQESKQFNALCQKEFACEQDAEKAINDFTKKLKLTEIYETKKEKLPKFNKKGRPAKDAKPDFYVWKITGMPASIIEARAIKLRRKSCYILASNQLDCNELPESELKRR